MNTTIQAQGLLPETMAESDYYSTPSNRGGPTINSWPGPARFEPDMFVHEVFDRQPPENLPWSGEDPSHHKEQVDSFGVPQEARGTTYMVTPNAHWDPHPLPGSYLSAQGECFVSPAMLDAQDDPFQLEYPPLEAGELVAGPSQPPLAAFRSDAQSQDNQLHYYYESMGLQDQHYVTLSDLNSDGQYASKNFQSGDIDAELGYRQNINLSGEQVDGTLQAGEEPVISRAQGKRPITDVYQDTPSKQGGRDNKRRHNSSDSSSHHSVEGIESEPAEDDDSDLYQPSRSPSPPLGSSCSPRRRSHISAAQALKASKKQPLYPASSAGSESDKEKPRTQGAISRHA